VSGERPLRLFVAIDLPSAVQSSLGGAIHTLRGADVGTLKWVASERIHLTLKFLGEVPAGRVPELGDALANVAGGHAPFSLQLAEGGAFPDAQAPRVLWLGLAGDLHALAALQRDVELALVPLGHPVEERPFRPHLTLARVPGRLPRSGSEHLNILLRELGAGHHPFGVKQISLMQSMPKPSGAEYVRLREAPLSAKTGQ
jgi:2'-5' RNA ligase